MCISSDTIKKIDKGHQAIVAAIDQVQLVARDFVKASPRLRELSEMLAAYIGQQNKEFYDELASAYAHDRQASKMLEFLIHDLKDIKVEYLEFFDKYLNSLNEIAARSFPKDFRRFVEIIISRMNVEEEYLLPLIENYKK